MVKASSTDPKRQTLGGFAVLGVLAAALLVGCGGSEQEAETGISDSAVDEVVEKVIDPIPDTQDAPPPGTQGDYSMEFVEGAPIPPKFPKDLPLPDGAELVGTFENPTSDAISMAVPTKPAELVISMESEYLDEGWNVTGAETNGRGEGLILATKDGRSVMTLIQPDASGNSVVKTIAVEGELK